MGLSLFSGSSMAMSAESHRLSQISANIANVNTYGYKDVTSSFTTVLSDANITYDAMGVRAVDHRNVSRQGAQETTGSENDLCIQGTGFFYLNTEADGSGEDYFTRAGNFREISFELGDDQSESYLCTQDGLYVMGWSANADGEFDGGAVGPIRTNTNGRIEGIQTTSAWIDANVDASGDDSQTFSIPVIDPAFDGQTLRFDWDRQYSGVWNLDFDITEGTIVSPAAGDVSVSFNNTGDLLVPADGVEIQIQWDSGETGTISLDMSKIKQYAYSNTVFDSGGNGESQGLLTRTAFNDDGILSAYYSNGVVRDVGKVALARFTAPDYMEAVSGNRFVPTHYSGDMQIVDIQSDAPNTSVLSETLELSTTDLAGEFTKMITTQRAYSSAAQVFKTSDEMLQEIGSLKR